MHYTGLQFSLQQKFALARTPSPTRETPIRLSLPMNFTHLLVRRASRRSRRSAGFCRFQGKLSVDMTNFERAFGILSFRPKCPAIAGFLFRLWHAITVSGFISSQTVIVRDVSTSVDMTELRSAAISRILLPMKLRHSLVREVHWPSRGSPSF